jgi:membrane peptidoglycan carboxypeptidase
MLMRDALANSYNVPAVDALQFVGVEGLLEMASRLGVASLAHPEEHCPDYPYEQPPTYGLALTLGGGEVKLLEMTGAFATFANQGLRMPPTPILRIEDSRGEVLVDNTERQGEQAVSAAHAYLMTHILSDTRARCQTFSCPSVLELDRPVAAKTGTTNDYRDAWTVGYTPDLATGVWVGNSDNAEMIRLPGSAGAGPIWHNFMAGAHQGLPVRDFQRPPDVVELEICADSGARPTEHCPRRKKEVFAKDQPPLDEGHDWYQKVQIDAHTGLLANEFCPDNVTEQVMIVIEDERGREWAQAHPEHFGGVPLAPRDACTESTVRPEVRITQPQSGSAVQGVVSIAGTAQMPDFSHYEVRYSGSAGSGWISGPHLTPVRDGVLTQWDVTNLPAGSYTIHVVAYDRENRQVEGRAQVNVAGPTKTPTPQPSLTPTWTRTVVAPTATWTPQPQPSATPTWTPTWTPPPAASPTATPSATPTTAITNTQPVTTTANQAATPTATREP